MARGKRGFSSEGPVGQRTMAELPEPLGRMISELKRLPGIGRRSAERIALHLVQSDREAVGRFAESVKTAREKVVQCEGCGALTEVQPCAICQSPLRDRSVFCVVAQPVDVILFERSHVFKGLYHVLGGQISPLDGIGPEDLRILSLERRIEPSKTKEVILALDSNVEGEATSFYLAKRLGKRGVRVTRLARGLPVGGGLEFADDLTLGKALEGRHEIKSE